MEDQRRRLDSGNPVTRQRGAIVEGNARAAQGNRVHLLDDASDHFPLPGRQLGDDGIGGAHQSHELLLEQLAHAPVKPVILVDGGQRAALLVCLSLVSRGYGDHPGGHEGQGRDPLGIQNGKEQRRRPAVRKGDHGDTFDAEMVEQGGVGMGLVVKGGAFLERRL